MVRQNGRIEALALVARRRMRRMELERPATDAVVVRDIMEMGLLCFLVRPRRFGPGQRP